MFYLANDVFKSWCTVLKGTPVEVISARDKSAIIIKSGNDRLTVSQYDITDVKPMETKSTIPAQIPAKVEVKQAKPAIVKQIPAKVEVKTVTQKSIF